MVLLDYINGCQIANVGNDLLSPPGQFRVSQYIGYKSEGGWTTLIIHSTQLVNTFLHLFTHTLKQRIFKYLILTTYGGTILFQHSFFLALNLSQVPSLKQIRASGEAGSTGDVRQR